MKNHVKKLILIDQSDDHKKKILLSNKLLSRPYRAVNQSLKWKACQLRKRISNLFLRCHQDAAANLADIYHESIKIFIELKEYSIARELCYTLIQRFVDWSYRTNNISLKKFAFQFWINLIRIDRFAGCQQDAMTKLDILTLSYPLEILVGENKVLKQSLYESLYQDVAMYHSIMSQALLERIKLFFEMKKYNELLEYIHHKKICLTKTYSVLVQEACAITYANLGKIQEAYYMLEHHSHHLNSHGSRVLKLRECEMRISLEHDENVIHDIHIIYDTCLKIIHRKCSIDDVVFALHVIQMMKNLGINEEVLRLGYACLESAARLGDEQLKAESLIVLYRDANDEAKNIIEDLMIEHYHATQYVCAREKMLTVYQDLKYVENCRDNQEIELLYMDLLELRFT